MVLILIFLSLTISIQHITNEFIKQRLGLLLGELYKIVRKDLLSIFNEEEMEMVLYGVPFIDVNEWKE